MIDILTKLLSNFILTFAIIYSWHILLNKTINLKNYKLYICLIGMIFSSTVNFFVTHDFIRIVLITVILILFFKYLFNENLHKSIVTPVYVQIIVFIAEFIYSITMLILFNDKTEEMINNVLFNFSTNSFFIEFEIFTFS